MNEEEFLYLDFDVEPKLSETEIIQILKQNMNEMGNLEENNLEEQLEEKVLSKEKKSNVPNFGTNKEKVDGEKNEWDLSGTIKECIVRHISRLDGKQVDEILLGLEQGLTDEQVKSYFKLPVDEMKKYRREYQLR